MSALGEAFFIASDVHKDQEDKAGAPYMLHCVEVMRMVLPLGMDFACTAILHDSVEDADANDQQRVAFHIAVSQTQHTIAAVTALTHLRHEPYDEYIERVAQNYIARKVKIADLTHNMDPRRIPAGQIVDKDFQRWEKYRRALIRLEREA